MNEQRMVNFVGWNLVQRQGQSTKGMKSLKGNLTVGGWVPRSTQAPHEAFTTLQSKLILTVEDYGLKASKEVIQK